MYVALGQSGCESHADCPGKDVYCQGGNCAFQPPEQMAECASDDECDPPGGYFCVSGRCGKRMPPSQPPPSGSPPSPKTPLPTLTTKAGINFDIIVIAAVVVGAGAYMYGRKR